MRTPAKRRYEESNAAIQYSAGWSNNSNPNFSGGIAKLSDNTTGRYAELTFEGRSIRVRGFLYNSYGVMRILIDGSPITDGDTALAGDTGVNKSGIDLYSPTAVYGTTYSQSNLSAGTHTIRLEVSGTKNASSSQPRINLDAFDADNDWELNQEADAACPSRLDAFVECRKSSALLRQVVGSVEAAHPGSEASFADDFDRANGSLGEDWTTITGSPTISSNQFYGGTVAAYYVPAGQHASFRGGAKIDNVNRCFAFGIVDGNNYFRLRRAANGANHELILERRVGGTWGSSLATVTIPLDVPVPQNLVVAVDGRSLSATYVEHPEFTLTATLPSDYAGGYLGLSTSALAFIDDFWVDLGGVVGQTMTFPDGYVVEGLSFVLALSGWTMGNALDLVLWTYDPDTHQLGDVAATGQATISGDFTKQEVTYTLTAPIQPSAGTYAALLLGPYTGALTAYYATGNRYADGNRITALERTAGSVMTEHAGEDLSFKVLGYYPVDQPQVKRWRASNDTAADNVVDAAIVATFDPTVSTLPVESLTLTIENGSYGGEPSTDYDFTTAASKAMLRAPGFIEMRLGYAYDDGGIETKELTRQRLENTKVSEDDLYVTFEASSFTSRLDEATFYGGRYDAGGIGVATLLTEVLEDVNFPEEGGWNYRLGDANCKVSAAGTRPLWGRTDFAYYHVDPTLDDIKVYVPIPPVTHREAITMLAAYAGAYIKHRSDGSLDIVSSLGDRLDYHLDVDRVYERPEAVQGAEIGKLTGAVHAYAVEASTETIVDVQVVAEDTNAATFRITHDGCDSGSLALTGATLVGDPVYNTYSTVFTAIPDDVLFQAVLTGKRVDITSVKVERTYQNEHGESRTFDNPIASDLSRTLAMFDRYQKMEAAMRFRFTMRDDAAVEVGDRCYLDTLAEPTGMAVIVSDIRRTFNGGVDGEYTVLVDPY